MKKALYIIFLCILSVNLVGCIKNDAERPVDISQRQVSDEEVNQPGQDEREMRTITISVKNTAGMPVPGVRFSVPKTNIIQEAAINGDIKFWSEVKEVSIPKIPFYKMPSVINFDDYEQNEIEVVLKPEEVKAGFQLIFPEVKRQHNGSMTTIEGKVVDENDNLIDNEKINFDDSSLNAKTDDQGNFKVEVPAESMSYRIYFPNLDNKKYYQIDTFKNSISIIDIEI